LEFLPGVGEERDRLLNSREIEEPLVVVIKMLELPNMVDLLLLDADVVECRPSCWN